MSVTGMGNEAAPTSRGVGGRLPALWLQSHRPALQWLLQSRSGRPSQGTAGSPRVPPLLWRRSGWRAGSLGFRNGTGQDGIGQDRKRAVLYYYFLQPLTQGFRRSYREKTGRLNLAFLPVLSSPARGLCSVCAKEDPPPPHT